jgi:hypothetical protein
MKCPPVSTSSLLGPNILLSSLGTNSYTLCSPQSKWPNFTARQKNPTVSTSWDNIIQKLKLHLIKLFGLDTYIHTYIHMYVHMYIDLALQNVDHMIVILSWTLISISQINSVWVLKNSVIFSVLVGGGGCLEVTCNIWLWTMGNPFAVRVISTTPSKNHMFSKILSTSKSYTCVQSIRMCRGIGSKVPHIPCLHTRGTRIQGLPEK